MCNLALQEIMLKDSTAGRVRFYVKFCNYENM